MQMPHTVEYVLLVRGLNGAMAHALARALREDGYKIEELQQRPPQPAPKKCTCHSAGVYHHSDCPMSSDNPVEA